MSEYDVRFHPSADRGAEQAYRWYIRRSSAAATEFRNQLERTIGLIAESPFAASQYLRGTRRRILRGFPYLVVYRVLGNQIQSIAIAHGSRRPGYWQQR